MLNENKSYSDLVKEHIELDKLIFNLPPKQQNKVKYLLKKRESLRKSNNIFAELRINIINKKLHNIKHKN